MASVKRKSVSGVGVFLIILMVVPFVISFSFEDLFVPGLISITGRLGDDGPCDYTCRSHCNASEAEVSQFCFQGEVCCRDLNVCGDGYLDGGEACDGGNLGGEDCESQGFFNGTLSCKKACSGFNTASCSNCGNDVCNDDETCAGCPSDCDGEQADCSMGQVCDLGSCVAAAPSVCSDLTSLNTCSNSSDYGQPWYCNADSELVENCTECGCQDGSVCEASGSCSGVQASEPSGNTYTMVDAVVSSAVELEDDVGTGEPVSWNGIRKDDKISFEITKEIRLSPEEGTESQSESIETHTIEVDRISKARGYVKITIYSDPLDVILYDGESQRVDLDGDGIGDVIIMVTDIGLNDFKIDIQEIDEEKVIAESEDEVRLSMIRRSVFFPGPALSPVLEESPEASMGEFVIVNILVLFGMIFYVFKFTKAVKRKK